MRASTARAVLWETQHVGTGQGSLPHKTRSSAALQCCMELCWGSHPPPPHLEQNDCLHLRPPPLRRNSAEFCWAVIVSTFVCTLALLNNEDWTSWVHCTVTTFLLVPSTLTCFISAKDLYCLVCCIFFHLKYFNTNGSYFVKIVSSKNNIYKYLSGSFRSLCH